MPVTGVDPMPPEWTDQIAWRLQRFADRWVPALDLPFTRDGLERFEASLLEQYQDAAAFRSGADADFVECAMAFIGEVYLRAYGGGWYVDTNPRSVFHGPPSVCLDTEDRTPISPYRMMTALLQRRTGRELTKIYDAQGKNSTEHLARRGPDARPVRDPIDGVTRLEECGTTPPAVQIAWEQHVPALVAALQARAGDAGDRLDRSVASLALLAPLVSAEYPDSAALQAGEGEEHHAQYVAYVGEVMLRAAGGHWSVRPAVGDESEVSAARAHVVRRDRRMEWVVERPHLALLGLVAGNPENLRRRLDFYRHERF